MPLLCVFTNNESIVPLLVKTPTRSSPQIAHSHYPMKIKPVGVQLPPIIGRLNALQAHGKQKPLIITLPGYPDGIIGPAGHTADRIIFNPFQFHAHPFPAINPVSRNRQYSITHASSPPQNYSGIRFFIQKNIKLLAMSDLFCRKFETHRLIW